MPDTLAQLLGGGLIKRIALIVALLVSLAAPAWADYRAGQEAYKRGDFKAALREWTPLAEQGHALAQFNLGVIYAEGKAVPRDLLRAAGLFRLAAAQGLAMAMNNLGLMYGARRSVPRDQVKAYAWFDLAAARLPPGPQKDGVLRSRGKVAENLSPDRLRRARELVRRWNLGDTAALGIATAPPEPRAAAPTKPPEPRATAPAAPPRLLVIRIQNALAALGYDPGPADGTAGRMTRAAIGSFQADHGLAVTGEVSDGLANELFAERNRRQTAVRDVCDRLAAHPLDSNKVGPGVEFDELDPGRALPSCEAAVRMFPDVSRLKFQYARLLHRAHDYQPATSLYRELADDGYAVAQLGLGYLYFEGRGGTQNYAEAVKWFRRAAESGLPTPLYNLGALRDKGVSVPQDSAEGLTLARKEAEQDDAEAKVDLGTGDAVPEDETEAARVRWPLWEALRGIF